MADKAKTRKAAKRPRRSFIQEDFDELWTPLAVSPEALAKAVLRTPAKPRS